jgi:hypothetical protein
MLTKNEMTKKTLMIFGAPEAALSQKQAASCKLAHPPQM